MKTFIKSALVPVAFLLVVRIGGHAEEKATSDGDFLIKSMTAGVMEIKLSEYAAKNANDEKVKDYAQQLVKDHHTLNLTIAENTKRLKIAVLAGQEKDSKEKMDKLSRLKGNDFDLAYLQQMIEDHEKAVALFESESKNGEDSDLKATAKSNLPLLKKHLQDARELMARLKK